VLDLTEEGGVACNATRYESDFMSAKAPLSAHIGHYIKAHVLPADVSVKAAAEVLGVSRPTLSKLLNGNASLSTDMALRLQRAFGADSEELLKVQAEIENVESRDRQAKIPVRTYARSFLQIRANDIQAWASGRIEPRQQLAALLRRLVNTTGIDLSKVDFPAYDDAERPGWDGCVNAGTTTPWIPIGISGWEFGCNADPGRKAQSDYDARLRHVAEEDRKNTTFVFVTPHKWPGKQAWERARRAEQQFHDVRAFDAGDLEQWLEQSVATQTWFAELIGASTEGLRSLDSCWSQWAEATEPTLSKELFSGQAEMAKGILTDWLCNPTSRPLAISAESSDEALAFLHCAAEALDDATSRLHSRCIVVDSADALQKAVRASTNFIAVVTSRGAEEAIAGLYRSQPVILIRPRSSLDERADIALDALDDDSFQKGMQAMGIDEHEGARLARASRQYPDTVHDSRHPTPRLERRSKSGAADRSHGPGWSLGDKQAGRSRGAGGIVRHRLRARGRSARPPAAGTGNSDLGSWQRRRRDLEGRHPGCLRRRYHQRHDRPLLRYRQDGTFGNGSGAGSAGGGAVGRLLLRKNA
jgi:addiction module HigA family antidote